ncbi:hypothetical protein HDU84_001677 [Entophlyctis sp. JEL0112]|nr:hypothetical protein HDU84_001677 [Entophlyctis sp. JEL0112]
MTISAPAAAPAAPDQHSSDGFATLVTSDGYVAGAVALAHSLRRAGSACTIVCLVAAPSCVSSGALVSLYRAFDRIVYVPLLSSDGVENAQNLALLGRPELDVTLTKLHVFDPDVTRLARVCFIDADAFAVPADAGNGSIDRVFSYCQPGVSFAAAPDVGWPDCFNSGVFVTRPNKSLFEALIWYARWGRASFDGGDQGLLNSFFRSWASGGSAPFEATSTVPGAPECPKFPQELTATGRLPFVFNVTPSAVYSYLPAVKEFKRDIAIVHFAGHDKPWNQARFSDGTVWNRSLPNEIAQLHNSWWQIYDSQQNVWKDEDKKQAIHGESRKLKSISDSYPPISGNEDKKGANPPESEQFWMRNNFGIDSSQPSSGEQFRSYGEHAHGSPYRATENQSPNSNGIRSQYSENTVVFGTADRTGETENFSGQLHRSAEYDSFPKQFQETNNAPTSDYRSYDNVARSFEGANPPITEEHVNTTGNSFNYFENKSFERRDDVSTFHDLLLPPGSKFPRAPLVNVPYYTAENPIQVHHVYDNWYKQNESEETEFRVPEKDQPRDKFDEQPLRSQASQNSIVSREYEHKVFSRERESIDRDHGVNSNRGNLTEQNLEFNSPKYESQSVIYDNDWSDNMSVHNTANHTWAQKFRDGAPTGEFVDFHHQTNHFERSHVAGFASEEYDHHSDHARWYSGSSEIMPVYVDNLETADTSTLSAEQSRQHQHALFKFSRSRQTQGQNYKSSSSQSSIEYSNTSRGFSRQPSSESLNSAYFREDESFDFQTNRYEWSQESLPPSLQKRSSQRGARSRKGSIGSATSGGVFYVVVPKDADMFDEMFGAHDGSSRELARVDRYGVPLSLKAKLSKFGDIEVVASNVTLTVINKSTLCNILCVTMYPESASSSRVPTPVPSRMSFFPPRLSVFDNSASPAPPFDYHVIHERPTVSDEYQEFHTQGEVLDSAEILDSPLQLDGNALDQFRSQSATAMSEISTVVDDNQRLGKGDSKKQERGDSRSFNKLTSPKYYLNPDKLQTISEDLASPSFMRTQSIISATEQREFSKAKYLGGGAFFAPSGERRQNELLTGAERDSPPNTPTNLTEDWRTVQLLVAELRDRTKAITSLENRVRLLETSTTVPTATLEKREIGLDSFGPRPDSDEQSQGFRVIQWPSLGEPLVARTI